jgi:hypothetical protein
MRITNPRFKPEDLFTQDYWGEINPPIRRYNAHPASRKSIEVVKRQLGKTIWPILKGRIQGRALAEGAAYNPSNPELSGLFQHFLGTIALVDSESLTNEVTPKDYVKTLPLEDDDELRLHLPSRQFITLQNKSGHIFPSGSLSIWHEGMQYSRQVRLESIAAQTINSIPVVYYPLSMDIDGSTKKVYVARWPFSGDSERIGTTNTGYIGGWWRTTRVEICQEGTPAEIVSEQVFRLRTLATE